MKCIGTLQAFFIWIIISLAVFMFVPENYTTVHQNGWRVIGLILAGWWLAGAFIKCDN